MNKFFRDFNWKGATVPELCFSQKPLIRTSLKWGTPPRGLPSETLMKNYKIVVFLATWAPRPAFHPSKSCIPGGVGPLQACSPAVKMVPGGLWHDLPPFSGGCGSALIFPKARDFGHSKSGPMRGILCAPASFNTGGIADDFTFVFAIPPFHYVFPTLFSWTLWWHINKTAHSNIVGTL